MTDIYNEIFKINFYDIDAFGNPRLSRITERLLVSAENHSEMLNWGHEYLQSEHGVSMVLIKNHIKILNKIHNGEKIELRTWALPRVYPIITRHFVAKNIDKNEPIWEATVECVLMNLEKRAIANGAKLNLTLPDPSVQNLGIQTTPYKFNRGERNVFLESPAFKTLETVASYSALDYNGHLNSARYVEYIENALGADFFSSGKISEFDIQYNEEIKPDEKIIIKLYEKENGFYVIGSTGEKINFEASICTK